MSLRMTAPTTPTQPAAGGADVSTVRLGRDALTYGLSFLVGRAASVIMLPVYTRYLSVEDYGVLHLVDLVLTVVVLLLREGVTAGTMRFFFKETTDTGRREVISTTFLLVQAFSIVAAACLFAGAPLLAQGFLPEARHAMLLRLAAASMLFEGCFLVPTIYFQITQRSRAFLAASLARLFLTVGLNVLFIVFLGWGVAGPLASGLIANIVLGVPLAAWLLRRVGLTVRAEGAVRLMRFGLPFRVAQIGAFVLTFGDRFVLQRTHGADAVGLYGLGYQFGFLLAMLSGVPFITAWNPQRFALAAEPRGLREERYNEGLAYLSLIVVSVGVGICLFVGPLLEIMSDPSYHPAAAFVPILVLAYAMQVWTDVVELGIQVSERTRYAMLATWASVAVVVVLYLAWIPRFGAFGAAWATLVAFTFRFACFYFFSQRLWPVAYDWRPTIRLALYGSAIVALANLWTPDDRWARIAQALAGTAAFAALAWFGRALPEGNRRALGAAVRRAWQAVATNRARSTGTRIPS
jgi:O-antigen/teichoic acid export membrane protein